MTLFVFLCLVQVASIGLALATVRRLLSYVYRYRFDESVYTLLFGFVHLRYFVALYLVMLGVTIAIELLFIFSLLPLLPQAT